MASFEFNVLGQTYVADRELNQNEIKEFEDIIKKRIRRRKKSSTTTATRTTATSTGTTKTYARTGRA